MIKIGKVAVCNNLRVIFKIANSIDSTAKKVVLGKYVEPIIHGARSKNFIEKRYGDILNKLYKLPKSEFTLNLKD